MAKLFLLLAGWSCLCRVRSLHHCGAKTLSPYPMGGGGDGEIPPPSSSHRIMNARCFIRLLDKVRQSHRTIHPNICRESLGIGWPAYDASPKQVTHTTRRLSKLELPNFFCVAPLPCMQTRSTPATTPPLPNLTRHNYIPQQDRHHPSCPQASYPAAQSTPPSSATTNGAAQKPNLKQTVSARNKREGRKAGKVFTRFCRRIKVNTPNTPPLLSLPKIPTLFPF